VEPGSLIELVSLGDHELGLQLFDDKRMFVLDESHPLGHTYKPIVLPDSLRQAIYLPNGAAESSRGEELLPAIVRTLKPYAEVQDCMLSALAVWGITTWVSDFLGEPISLLVSGDFDHAISLSPEVHQKAIEWFERLVRPHASLAHVRSIGKTRLENFYL
jgi:hypothetical protein